MGRMSKRWFRCQASTTPVLTRLNQHHPRHPRFHRRPAPLELEPKPPTPPPGVFCTTPVLTPRNDPPACVRRTSAAAIGRLYRAIAISRLFSSASEIAFFKLSSRTPLFTSASIRGELARLGCGTSVARYVFNGLFECGISRRNAGCAGAGGVCAHHCLLHLGQHRHLHQRNHADATKQRKTPTHAFTSAPADVTRPAVSRYIHPSRSSIVRFHTPRSSPSVSPAPPSSPVHSMSETTA